MNWVLVSAAVFIIMIELTVTLLMLWPNKQKLGAITGAILMSGFTVILAIKFGDWLEYGCGCVGDDTGHEVGMKDIIKNVMLLSMLGLMMWMEKGERSSNG